MYRDQETCDRTDIPAAGATKQRDYDNSKQNMGDCMQTQAVAGYGSRPYSLRDEAQKRVQEHAEQGEKALAALQFFTAHPEFEEFIRLIRSGAIQI